MQHSPEDVRKAYYFQGVLEYVVSEYDTGYEDQGQMEFTLEMAELLDDCFSTVMCYPNAAAKFVERFVRVGEKHDNGL
jgi:hypothetical protein